MFVFVFFVFALLVLGLTGGAIFDRRSKVRPSTVIGKSYHFQHGKHTKPLLNHTERFFFHVISSALREKYPGQLGVLPQVPLSQIVDIRSLDLEPQCKARAFSLVCDFVIFDRDFFPVAAVEINGRGHYQNGWKERDALKARVLSQAGIPLKVIKTSEWHMNFKESKKRLKAELPVG